MNMKYKLNTGQVIETSRIYAFWDYFDYYYLGKLDWRDKHKMNWLCRLLDYIQEKR